MKEIIIKNRLLFIVIIVCLFSRRVMAVDYQLVAEGAHEYKHLVWTNSIITFLVDSYGNKYVVKQLKHQSNKPFCCAKIICELVALDVGHAINIPQNHVCIIPAGVSYIGKEVEVPATLHTHVPGIRFDKYPQDVFPGLAIKQRDHQGRAIGLTRDLVYQMSRHKDFPAIVAFDTFVGNPARHKHNFFYDETTDIFYGIDMGASFHKDLCKLSLKTIQSFLQDKQLILSVPELEALGVYCDTLKELVNLHKPIDLCNKLDEYAQLAGLFDSTYFDKDIQASCFEYLSNCKKNIHESYKHAGELINALERLFKKSGLKKGRFLHGPS